MGENQPVSMSIESKIIQAIRGKRPGFANITEQHLEPIQDKVYRLWTTPSYFIKWIPDNDRLGQNEIWVNQTILQKEDALAPCLIFTIRLDEGSVAGWEWLEGIDLRHQHRDYLPQAFAKLGQFHANQRHEGVVYSLITRQGYNTPKELLESEHKFLCTYHDDEITRKAMSAFSVLEAGYPTYIHGDLHPGNIHLTGKGIRFVDWSYSISSLSLFDLSYVETICFEATDGNEWWSITPDKSKKVLPAYFDASGLEEDHIDQILQAVMLWTKLWAYYNSIRLENKSVAIKCKQQIRQLI